MFLFLIKTRIFQNFYCGFVPHASTCFTCILRVAGFICLCVIVFSFVFHGKTRILSPTKAF